MQKPSYTEQAKQYTAKGADILHGQAEYLKGKLVGTQGTGAPAVLRPSPPQCWLAISCKASVPCRTGHLVCLMLLLYTWTRQCCLFGRN